METMLFTADSVWTMIHGIVLGGGALIALAVALFALRTMRVPAGADPTARGEWRPVVLLLVFAAAALWATVLVGTYVNFPPYRATPPEGVADLAQYPRALLRSNPATAWLHGFGMEIKEHVPWIAAMLTTAVASVGLRYRSRLLRDPALNALASSLVAVGLVLVAFVAVLGIFINKVAPLD